MTSDLTGTAFDLTRLADSDLGDVPVLTIKQPWAHAIFHLGKRVENRTWRPLARWRHYRGPLLVHASARDDALARRPDTGLRLQPATVTRGAILGVVILTDVHAAGAPGDPDGELDLLALGLPEVHAGCWPDALCSPWAERGVQHWTVTAPTPFRRPVYCAGALGLWTPERLPVVPRSHLRAELASLPPVAAPVGHGEPRTPRGAVRDPGNAPASATGPATTPTGDDA